MNFSEQLKRLRTAAEVRQEGIPPDKAMVNVRDLRELLYHFDRIDADLRSEYYSCQKLSGRFATERKQYEARITLLTQQLLTYDAITPRVIHLDGAKLQLLEDVKYAELGRLALNKRETICGTVDFALRTQKSCKSHCSHVEFCLKCAELLAEGSE